MMMRKGIEESEEDGLNERKVELYFSTWYYTVYMMLDVVVITCCMVFWVIFAYIWKVLKEISSAIPVSHYYTVPIL